MKELKKHMKCHIQDGDFICNVCPYQTNTLTKLNNHLKDTRHDLHKGGRHDMTLEDQQVVQDFICQECGIECETVYELDHHKETHVEHNQAKDFICDECGIDYETNGDLKKHKVILHTLTFECRYCDFKTNDDEDFNNHKKEHHKNVDTNSKNNSEIELGKEGELERHNRTHTFTCDICNYKTNSNDSFREHGEENHMEVDTNFACDLCGIDCETIDKLELHKVTHMSAIKCDKCNIQTSDKNDLIRHILQNHNDSLVVSNQNMIGDISSDNDRATGSHTEIEKRFNCKFCVDKFRLRSDMRQHIKATHKTYKPCRNFTSSNNCAFGDDCIYNHDTITEGEQICFSCGDKFRTKHDLINHMKTAHGYEPCRKFMRSICKYSEDSCFFSHNLKKTQTPSTLSHNLKHTSFFQNSPEEWPNLTTKNMNVQEKIMEMIPRIMETMLPQLITQLTTIQKT